MTEKDSLAILGLLMTLDIYPSESMRVISSDIVDYLKELDLSYEFVYKILSNEFNGYFFHINMGQNSDLLPEKYEIRDLVASEHDNQIWITENGQIGVWCEIDGFIAWLDEYKKVWVTS